jgi:hypothetical protein
MILNLYQKFCGKVFNSFLTYINGNKAIIEVFLFN